MIRARPSWGARAVFHDRQRLKQGMRDVALLYRKGQTVGFVIHRKLTRVGMEAEALYLTPGNRTPRAFREVMGSFQRRVRVFTVAAWSPALNPRAMAPALKDLGFRLAHRQWLYLDLSGFEVGAKVRAPFPVRRLRKTDEKGIARLSSRAYAHHIDSAFGPGGDARVWASDYVHDVFADRRRPIDYECSFVWMGRRRPVGDVIVIKGDEGPHILDLSVDPTFRRRGIGAALLHQALGALSDRRIKRVNLSVTVENPTGALELYRSAGFRRVPGPARWPGIWVNEAARRRMRLRIRGE